MEEYIADYLYTESISCIGESSSVSARFGDRKLVTSAYEKIMIWNIDTLSVENTILHAESSPVTAMACTGSEEDLLLLVGHEKGSVKCIDTKGNEVFGFREHIKKIIGVCVLEDIAVVYTTSAFTLVDLRTESAICSVPLDIQISSVRIFSRTVVVGTVRGIVHKYEVSDLLNGVQEATMLPLAGNQIFDFLEIDEALYAVLPECVVNIATKDEMPIKHRISFVSTLGASMFTKDTKGKYHWMSIREGKIEEKAVFKNTRPIASLQVYDSKAVAVFADNGISVHRSQDFITSVEGGRENLLALVNNNRTILGITETEGKVFATAADKDVLNNETISNVLFEDEGMQCIAVHSGKYYIGKKDGSLSVRDAQGNEIENIALSNSPIASLDVKDRIIAVGTESKVILLEGAERDELEYDEDIVCVRLSADGSLVVASLTDNTVKIHKIDGTRVLSLYGHSVPVVDICICQEKGLIYTLGGDKLVKVWGMSHGDCRKTINPIDPAGILLHDNLLIVSTAYGMIYYLKDTFEKVKKIEYRTGKKRAVPGENRMAVVDCYLLAIRERAVSLFTEEEYGTTLIEQKVLEERAQETEEISKENRIYKISAVEELETALDENSTERVYESLKKLSQNDLEKTIDIMNTETQNKLLDMLSKLPHSDCNPLTLAWSLGRLAKKNLHNENLEGSIEKIRAELRKQARTTMANRAALLWSIKENADIIE
ncbi:U3 small nucleolar RNA-associated protein 12 [Nematocida minor]|uniref:U3 small nucleolar RNA-associated protein 12 n=1 Tax=Nematocida minor TaxID=1912983 RepID=UPI0022208977|nr:U3 small nucleolar RNA-associated protein 12 [Nematocida minor]KAI5190570.1 U3 small nucleolar RNA-associated protein 12 [Nematocida minor]